MNELNFEETTTEEQPIDFEPFYNCHYIRTDENGNIIDGWSDAFPQDTEGAICINEQGGYQFRLWPEGEENPNLFTMDMIPLYKWDGEKVVKRTGEEVGADRAAMPKPPVVPTTEERLTAMESAMLTMAMALAEE